MKQFPLLSMREDSDWKLHLLLISTSLVLIMSIPRIATTILEHFQFELTDPAFYAVIALGILCLMILPVIIIIIGCRETPFLWTVIAIFLAAGPIASFLDYAILCYTSSGIDFQVVVTMPVSIAGMIVTGASLAMVAAGTIFYPTSRGVGLIIITGGICANSFGMYVVQIILITLGYAAFSI